MAENKPLSVVIDADISKLQKAISDVKESIGQISSAIKNTDLGDFGKGLEQSLSQINTRLDQLEGNLQKTANTAKTFTTGTKDARTALTSLSLVAQDLPFGFIAIQNNLPNLIQAFGNLDTKTKGLKGVIAELRTSLVGPAGAFLAFSILTSAVTFAIQKYGSFEAAIKSLLGTITQLDLIQKRAKDSLAEYNKQLITNNEITGNASSKVADQIFKVQTLSEAIKDTTLSETQRKSAIEEIQKLDPKTLENLNLQTKNYKNLDEFVKKYTDSLIANAVAQEYLSQVVATTTQITQQTNVLAEIGKGYADIAKKRRELNAEPIFDPATGAELTNTALSGLLIREQNLNEEFAKQTGIVNNLWKQLDNYKNSAKSATIESLKFFKTTKENNRDGASFKFEIEPLAENLSLQQRISQLERLGTILLDTKSKESDRIQALKELSDLEYDVWGGIKLQDLSYQELRATLVGVGKTYQQLILQEEQRRESLRLTEEAIKRQAFLNKEDEKVFLSNIKAKRDELTKLRLALPKFITVPVNIPINQENIDKLGELSKLGIQFGQEEKDIEENEKRFVDSVKKLNSAIENGLRKPFRDFFDELLDNGKFTFDSFVDLAKDSFKRILADLAAAGIARILTSILTGGQSDAILAGGSIFDAIFGKKVAAPSFSGVGGGPLQMAGAVNLQLRGSDLVASINRTNTTINRVG